MKNSFGDIIYLILMIVIAIVSVVSKAKKKARAEIDLPENSSDEIQNDEEVDVLQKIDDWLNRASEPEIEHSHEVTVSEEKVDEKQRVAYSPIESSFSKEYKDLIKRRESKNIDISDEGRKNVKEEASSEEFEWFSNDEDLQRAFIYSEILKRPNI